MERQREREREREREGEGLRLREKENTTKKQGEMVQNGFIGKSRSSRIPLLMSSRDSSPSG
jgi:hypothetical protein